VAIALHLQREHAVTAACDFINEMADSDIVCLLTPEALSTLSPQLKNPAVGVLEPSSYDIVELAVVFGGDGTILRAAEWAVPAGIPLLGVNLGHVGFLAELEQSEMGRLVARVQARDYEVEERLCLQVTVRDTAGGSPIWESFAINEVSLEKAARERMIEVLVDIDGHPLSRWGTDGVLVSTPTGSTAYAFSAQGPVLWPDLDALLVVPLLAHALFARPLVLSPTSVVTMELIDRGQYAGGVLWCDGRRSVDVEPHNEIEVRRSPRKLRLARMSAQPFVHRLVRKFDLPVDGWRGPYGSKVWASQRQV
jgi:NAD+ kinase